MSAALALYDGPPPSVYVGVPVSIVCVALAFVFLFRDTIVEGAAGAAGQTIRLGWYTKRKLDKLFKSKGGNAWNAWHCLHCDKLRESKDVAVYCVKQTNGRVVYYLEGKCVVTNIKGACIIGKKDLKTAGVPLNLEPRPAAPQSPPPETFIDARIKENWRTNRFGGGMVTGFGISSNVAQLMEQEWPTMGDFAKAQQQEIAAWKQANNVRKSLASLWFARNQMKEHLDS